jgi:hypothetical protein
MSPDCFVTDVPDPSASIAGVYTLPESAALITGLILERPLCLDCLAAKSGLGATAVEAMLARVGTVMRLHRWTDRCRACGETRETVSVARPDR